MTYHSPSKIAARAAIFFTLVFFAGCGYVRFPYTTPPAAPHPPVSKLAFGYVANAFYPGSVSQFQISSAGLWTATTPDSVPAGGLPYSLAVDPSGRFVYAANSADNTVSQYVIDLSTGALAPNSPATMPTGIRPNWLTIDSLGRFLYTANTADCTISIFRIDQTSGALNATVPATVPVLASPSGCSKGAVGLVVDPKGNFLYAVGERVEAFAVDAATGLLSPVGPMLPVGAVNRAPAIDPSGTFLYIPSSILNELEVLAINPTTGALSPAAVPSVPAGEEASSIALDPSGRFLYVANRTGHSISQFLVGPGGSLTPMSIPVVQDSGLPWQILVDPSGELAYVSNEATTSVTIYRIGADGALNAYSLAAARGGAYGMGVARRR